MVQLVSDEVRKRVKNIRDVNIVEILENCVDLLTLGIGKARGLKDIKEDVKVEDEDIRDYVTKVINKLDKITANL
jgi:hypothetical protein